MTTAKTLLGTFIAAFVVTVGAITVGAVVLDDGTQTTQVEQNHIDASLVADQLDDGGEITMESDEPTNTIVIHTGTPEFAGPPPMGFQDQSTDSQLSAGGLGGPDRDVGPLASTLVDNGHEVVYYEDERQDGPLGETLSDADGLLLVGSADLTPQEQNAVSEFVDGGGQTIVAANPGPSNDVSEITASKGLYAEAGFLYNLVENDNNYLSLIVEPTGDEPLTDGVDEAVFRSVAPIGSSHGEPIMETDEQTRESTTREAGTYGAAAMSDNLVLLGDSSFMEPENAYRADNNVLIGNVADFLVTGAQPDGVGDGFPEDDLPEDFPEDEFDDDEFDEPPESPEEPPEDD